MRRRDDPPSNWCDWWADLTRVTEDIYFGWPRNENPADDEANPYFWHWCPARASDPGPAVEGQWRAASTARHTLVAREPLHLEPSLLWPCCGTHGWVRGGQWTNA